MTLDEFIKSYFEEIKKVNEFHFSYLVHYRFTFPKHNYIKLKRFIDTATNFLSEIDDTLMRGLTAKLYNDLDSLYQFYKTFSKKTKYDEYIFINEYLPLFDIYKNLKEKSEQLKIEVENYNKTIMEVEAKLKVLEKQPDTEEKLKKMKDLKKTHVDSIYYLSKIKEEYHEIKSNMHSIEKREREHFLPLFEKEKNIHLKKLEKIINTKLFYYEKLLWKEAAESKEIIKFFDNSNIEGDFSTKTFINYYLKNIDLGKSSNTDWYVYLNEILKVIE